MEEKLQPSTSTPMDRHAVPAAVENEYRDRKSKHASRHIWPDEYISKVTDWARQSGVKGALQKHTTGPQKEHELPYQTVNTWLKHYKKTGIFWRMFFMIRTMHGFYHSLATYPYR